jgi:hypothetical protein
MLINTADQYPFTGPSHDKTRMHQGWGMPNVQTLYDLREGIYVIDESDVLEPFDVAQHIVEVEPGTPSLKVTLAYTDPPGNPAVQTQHRVNDLTLKVISPSETIYWGNYGLLDGVWSTPDGEADTKNTVECVFVENPEDGNWTIEVSADELIEDAHVETPELDADYALVACPVVVEPSGLTLEIKGGLGVSAVVTNIGVEEVSDVDVELHVQGGLLGMINQTVTDTFDIPTGETKTVSTGMFFGFGTLGITAIADNEEVTVEGLHFFVLSLIS